MAGAYNLSGRTESGETFKYLLKTIDTSSRYVTRGLPVFTNAYSIEIDGAFPDIKPQSKLYLEHNAFKPCTVANSSIELKNAAKLKFAPYTLCEKVTTVTCGG